MGSKDQRKEIGPFLNSIPLNLHRKRNIHFKISREKEVFQWEDKKKEGGSGNETPRR